MPVIATAGHVDHGKSALVQALTGTDPDRLREEKERGLTIDLGFAELRLPSGENVSIVDVPGHERFIKNMLAGVGGIDLALLVVSADEGVMPQTREHLAIIDLLGVERGVVALTKADLVNDTSAAEIEVREVLAGTTLEDAPIVACSVVTRSGLDVLMGAIETQLEAAPERRDLERPRLAIDRVFTMAGFGTVVTGTLADGSLQVGTEVEVLPGGHRARIRGLQNHGRQVDTVRPGRRTALNLAGIAVDELRRGMVVAMPGTLRPTTALDAKVRTVPYLAMPVRHGIPVTFYTGAVESEARLSLLEADALAAGESGWAQLRLAEPVVILRGDRFIVRDPNGTLGGGVVVDTDVQRHRRFHPETIASLQRLESGSPVEIQPVVTVALTPRPPVLTAKQERAAKEYLARLRQNPFSPPTDWTPSPPTLAHLLQLGEAVKVRGNVVFSAEAYREMVARITERLRSDGSLTLAEVRDMFGTSRRYAQALLEHLDDEGITRRVADTRVLH